MGIWISGESYQNWQEKQSSKRVENSAEGSVKTMCSTEKSGPKFCPECSHFMIKYRVAHDVEFCLDRCGNCFGLWFDGNEWQLLKDKGIHKQIHLIFSQNWQSRIRQKEQSIALDSMWIDRLGREDYARMTEYIEWLASHDKQDDLLAFQFSSMGLSS